MFAKFYLAFYSFFRRKVFRPGLKRGKWRERERKKTCTEILL